MQRALGIAVLAVLLGGGTSAAVRAGEDGAAEETEARLALVRAGPERAGWTDAVARLRAGDVEVQARLDEALHALAAARSEALARAAKRVEALAERIGEGSGTAARRLEAWEQARAAATEWIFDPVRFPVPEDPVITGPREGYGEAKRRGDLAVAAWRRLSRLLDRATAPALGLSAKAARRLQAAWAEARDALAPIVGALPAEARSAYPEPEVTSLARWLLALRLGAFADVAAGYAGLDPGWTKACLFAAYARSLLDWNEDHPFGMPRDAAGSIVVINEYRIALGISPVAHAEALVRMAAGHSQEMASMGYFSHRSPVPEHATKEMRAALQGYEGHVVECITGAGSGGAAVEFWKYDGGHHRDMVDPQWVEGGFGTAGPSVYDGGAGGPGSIPVIRY